MGEQLEEDLDIELLSKEEKVTLALTLSKAIQRLASL